MIEKLNDTNRMTEFVEVLNTYYDLQGCKPSVFILVMLISAVQSKVIINDKSVIERCKQSKSLHEFLMTYAKYYDMVNKEFKADHKKAMINNIANIVRMTLCKKIQ